MFKRKFNGKICFFIITLFLVGVIVGAGLVAALSTSTFTLSSGVYPGAPSYTVWVESGAYYVKNAYGYIVTSGSDAGLVAQYCVDSLPDTSNPIAGGISIHFASGTYAFATTCVINKHDVKISGEGRSTIFYPTTNNPIFKISNTPATYENSIWRTELCDFKMIDVNRALTSAGFIYLNNAAGGINLPYIHDVTFEFGYKGLYTDSSGLTSSSKGVFHLRLEQINFEGPRYSAIYLNRATDVRVNDISISINGTIASTVITLTNPEVVSVGAFWDKVTILRVNNSAVMNGLIKIEYTNELTMNNVILDAHTSDTGTGYLLQLQNVTRSKFTNWLVWHSSTDGVKIETGCCLNLFDKLYASGNVGYGLNDATDLTTPNAFYNFFGENNVAGDLNPSAYDLYTYAFAPP